MKRECTDCKQCIVSRLRKLKLLGVVNYMKECHMDCKQSIIFGLREAEIVARVAIFCHAAHTDCKQSIQSGRREGETVAGVAILNETTFKNANSTSIHAPQVQQIYIFFYKFMKNVSKINRFGCRHSRGFFSRAWSAHRTVHRPRAGTVNSRSRL